MSILRAATVQFQHVPSGIDKNLGTISSFVAQASEDGVQLIVFPECCVTGYWHLRNLDRDQLEELAEEVPDGRITRQLLDLAARYRLTIGAGFVERADDGQLFNSYVVALPDGRYYCHRKIHCFISEHMASGEEFTVFEMVEGHRLGVLICYDNNIGENVRLTALAGAEILLAPHQTGGCDSGSPFAMGVVDRSLWDNRLADPEAIEAEFRGDKGRGWLMRWLPARAHDNGLFLLFSNGVGADDDEVRTGNAMILDPYGRIVAETWQAEDAMVVADLDLSLRTRSTGSRWIRARRPDLYGPLTDPTGEEEATRRIRFEHKE
ncbi:MAG: nitrilase family protein [Planctomycetota bacterium]|nr:nitrilase family protein [Planctomycetota bacterium]